MRKLKIFSVLLLLVSAGAFIAFQAYMKVVQDDTPPVVICDSKELTVTVAATDEELLEGVSAKDRRSGDVTDTLVIESLSAFTEDGTRIITYAAVDESMNVGRCERTLIYEDYEPPVFHMSEPLCYMVGSDVDILSAISADSTLDGSLTSNIKYSLEKTVNTMTAGNYPIEFRVMDSGGKTVYLDTQIEIYDRTYAGIEVNLTDYLVYVKQGQEFDPQNYYAGADREGELTIQSNVNTSEAGTYYVDYIVNGISVSGKSRLVVVVQEG
ncbi:MAG: hypothetical protein Q4C52_05310 [Eubacteriales bacterium]|nr:hypothetical protein [Eubacteriales bacterium]